MMFFLLAEAEAGQGAPVWAPYLLFGFVGLMFLMFMRSSQRQAKELQKSLAALKKNDKVVTSGGILGMVVNIKEGEDEVTLKVDDTSNTRIRVLRSSIVKIVSGETTVGEVKQ